MTFNPVRNWIRYITIISLRSTGQIKTKLNGPHIDPGLYFAHEWCNFINWCLFLQKHFQTTILLRISMTEQAFIYWENGLIIETPCNGLQLIGDMKRQSDAHTKLIDYCTLLTVSGGQTGLWITEAESLPRENQFILFTFEVLSHLFLPCLIIIVTTIDCFCCSSQDSN